MIRTIKTKSDYDAALARFESLVALDPDYGTPEAEEMEVLSLVIGDHESKNFPTETSDPIEAILFRMEQQNLTQKDLVPYIGSKSRVSEVLSRKRPLTLSMARALHKGLGIPAKVLLQDWRANEIEESAIEWDKFPVQTMVTRGWIKTGNVEIGDMAGELARRFFAPLGPPKAIVGLAKATRTIRSARKMDNYALVAWAARIMLKAMEIALPTKFEPGSVTLDFMSDLAHQSWSDLGPLLAQEFLNKHGIHLIVEPHLPHTYLDGLAVLLDDGTPIVGLSLRHDRIDNFWFCLMHELAHIAKHLNETSKLFYDDLELEDVDDPREREADEMALNALIPEEEWGNETVKNWPALLAIEQLAKKYRVHPAVVAGRIRHERKSYKDLNRFVGHGQVRQLFEEIDWKAVK